MIMRHGKLLWSFKSEAFYSQKITKVSNTTVRKIVLEYIHYYNCVRIQEKLNHLSLKNLGNKWFRCFDWCPVFGVHFKISIFLYVTYNPPLCSLFHLIFNYFFVNVEQLYCLGCLLSITA